MALLLRSMLRPAVLSRTQACVVYRHAVPMGTSTKEDMSKFWDKNARLKRPLSPHISIYSWSIPMMMSISHRGTGVALSSGTACPLASLRLTLQSCKKSPETVVTGGT
uniref:Succinate dehydrogenase cytochrome b560 subunit, mitochondrial n=1 Tax=Lepisosteus oculatus TaxID=7918 RepID=W5M0B7_LEPOC